MADKRFTILASIPTVYSDPVNGIVNGVLVRFKLDQYDEVHEVRIPKMDAKLAAQAIAEVADQRDALEALSTGKTK